MLQEAIEALNQGNHAQAFTYLARYLAANPKDANGWLWMSEATTNPLQQIDALQRVLLLAPEHPRAESIRKRLRHLNASTQPQQALGEAPPPAVTPPALSHRPSVEEQLAQLRGDSFRNPTVSERGTPDVAKVEPPAPRAARPAPPDAGEPFLSPTPPAPPPFTPSGAASDDSFLDLASLLDEEEEVSERSRFNESPRAALPPAPVARPPSEPGVPAPGAAPVARPYSEPDVPAPRAAPVARPYSEPDTAAAPPDELDLLERLLAPEPEARPAVEVPVPPIGAATPQAAPVAPAPKRVAEAGPPPTPGRAPQSGIPVWVWLIMAISLFLVGAFIVLLLNMTNTGAL